MKHLRTLLVLLLLTGAAAAQTTQPSPVAGVIAAIDARLKQRLTPEQLVAIDTDAILPHATPDERAVLGTKYITFDIAADADVYVMTFDLDRNKTVQVPEQIRRPFWLAEQGWQSTPHRVVVQTREYVVYHKRFPAGTVGVGLHSFGSEPTQHLFVAVKGVDAAGVTHLPPRAKLDVLTRGKQVHADRAEVITDLPAELDGAVSIRPHANMGRVTKLIGKYRLTKYPSTENPDFVTQTWSDDPRTTQTIQWRTSTKPKTNRIGYWTGGDPSKAVSQDAVLKVVDEPTTLNDPSIHWWTVELKGLQPGTKYSFRVGESGGVSDVLSFETAPEKPEPFTFVYLGDAQNGLEDVGNLLWQVYKRYPEAKFYLLAGDLVEWGDQRDNWDELFAFGQHIFQRRPIVPVVGNHDIIGGGPRLYLDFFRLPADGPRALKPGRAYTLNYGHLSLAVLDSNLDADKPAQAAWLKEKFAASTAPWKLTSYHHPLYSGTPGGDNQKLRDAWGPAFDECGVACALQGHVHAYFRSHPIKAGQVVPAGQGTIYTVALCGTKCYPSEDRPYGAVNKNNLRTYQLITVEEKRLIYRAYNDQHELIDEFTLHK